MTMTLLIYWLIGMTLMLIAYSAMPRPIPLEGIRGFFASLFACLLWPLVLLTLWYEHQRFIWQQGSLSEKRWLREKERSGEYHLGKHLSIVVRYSPRRVLWRGAQYTTLLRPRPSIQPLLLFSPNALHLNLFLFQVIILRVLPSPKSSSSSAS